MVQRMILKNQEKCIYEIEEGSLKFYMMIPNNSKVSLVISVIKDPTDISIQKIIQDKSNVLVIPKISNDILDKLSTKDDNIYNYLDKYISNLINLSHKILVYNHLNVLNVVNFNSADYKDFQDWFIKKYEGRVQYINLVYEEEQKVSPVLEDVKAIDNTMTLASSVEQSVMPTEFSSEDISNNTLEPQGSFGFVSYVLLGVVAAVATLIFLYLIL